MAIWEALDGKSSIAKLRERFASVDNVLNQFAALGICELPPPGFPSGRRRILVIEPHMDDAALSVGGTMWLRRNECEFTVLTLAGLNNFTSYYLLERDFFDIAEVTALRKAESALCVKHFGGHHTTLDFPEAPLRYRNARWSLDWFRQHRDAIWTFVTRSPAIGESGVWTAALTRLFSSLDAEEIWMPLGVGDHVDHQLAREACLQILSNPELIGAREVRFYEDLPYAANWLGHSDRIIAALRSAGACVEQERVNLGDAMKEKLHLLSIFASQFKLNYMQPIIEKATSEVLYQVSTAPSEAVDPISCYADSLQVFDTARSIAPWVGRHRSSSLVRLFVLTPFGRWADDMRLLLDLFPEARIEVFVARRHTVETEAFSSPRIRVRPVDSGQWHSAAAHLLFGRPSPLVIVSPGKERYARWLSAACVGSDPMIAPSLNAFTLALRLASVS